MKKYVIREAKTRAVNVYMPEKLYQELQGYVRGNMSWYVREALREKMERESAS